jgi:hypothetical protein
MASSKSTKYKIWTPRYVMRKELQGAFEERRELK